MRTVHAGFVTALLLGGPLTSVASPVAPKSGSVDLSVQWEVREAPVGGGPESVRTGKTKVLVPKGKEVLLSKMQRSMSSKGTEKLEDTLFVKLEPSETPAAVHLAFRFEETMGSEMVFSAHPAMDLKLSATGELEETLKSAKVVRTLKLKVSAEEKR